MNTILLGKSKRRGARNENNLVPFELDNTFKPALVKNIKSSVDLYEKYMSEYESCSEFRITLTVKPYCTNILFNVCTEVVKNEGSDNCYPVCDNEHVPVIQNAVFGKTNGLYRNYMVSNTEYSSPEIGFEYLPGYDIFDNHTLRNTSFRPVMKVSGNTGDSRNVFNTVRDYMRDENGNIIYFYPRFSEESIENNTKDKMHIYEHGNLLPFIDGTSFETNIVVENGWYGFTNNAFVKSFENDGKNNIMIIEGHDFSHTINNAGNCEFIDLFPDRKRYSFVPMYNKHRKRYEKNWDVFLTYPWKNFYDHNLVTNMKRLNNNNSGDKKTNALATIRTQWLRLTNNRETFLFRSFCKHGLSINDKVAIYLSLNNGMSYRRLPKAYRVDYVGDVNGNNSEYFFGISMKGLLNDIFYENIENIFYSTNNIDENGSPKYYTVSNMITEVPLQVSNDVVMVYFYKSTSTPNEVYDESSTFDTMPKTVNSLSKTSIRVWDGYYKYMTWENSQSQYIETEENVHIKYGAWNTFTDEPTYYVKDCIRVKKYRYYVLDLKKCQLKKELREGTTTISKIINDWFNQTKMPNRTWHVRFAKIVNDVDCVYYIRKFKKIPNLKYSEEDIPEGLASNIEAYEDFINRNALDDNGKMLNFDSEHYKLAFSKTLYGDDVVQITFTDNINVKNLTDNLGRPVTDIYATIVKRNAGYKKWYESMGSDFAKLEEGNEDVEFSRCFGSVTTGLEYLDLDDIFDREDNTRKMKGMMSSVASLYKDTDSQDITPLSLEDWDMSREEKEIMIGDDTFFGDVIEYSPSQFKETVLCEAGFRFNTAQREIGSDGENEYFNFSYTELDTDDFDPIEEGELTPFRATTYKQWLQNDGSEETEDISHNLSIRRREGYFYKPHTKIPLFKFSDDIQQASHRTLRVKECSPVQLDGIQIKVTTKTAHGVGGSTPIYICYGNDWYLTFVSHVIDRFSFTLKPIEKADFSRNAMPYVDWVTTCEKINSGEISVRVKNNDIPAYASRIGENIFVWRNLVNPAYLPDSDAYKHPFSNNTFYVDCLANVYLRRQDPFGLNGLFTGDMGDIEGKPRLESNNEYQNERNVVCY